MSWHHHCPQGSSRVVSDEKFNFRRNDPARLNREPGLTQMASISDKPQWRNASGSMGSAFQFNYAMGLWVYIEQVKSIVQGLTWKALMKSSACIVLLPYTRSRTREKIKRIFVVCGAFWYILACIWKRVSNISFYMLQEPSTGVAQWNEQAVCTKIGSLLNKLFSFLYAKL